MTKTVLNELPEIYRPTPSVFGLIEDLETRINDLETRIALIEAKVVQND